MNRPIRLVITGGGTGGHVYPALAVAQAFQGADNVEAILYIGNETSLERDLVPKAGIPFESIRFSGMPRGKNPVLLLQWLFAAERQTRRAQALLRDFRPTVVFGTGGYVSAPVLMAAKRLGVPYVVHEPDAHPGLVNRLMCRWAALTTGAFEAARTRLNTRRFVATGNPIRSDIGRMSKAEALRVLGVEWSVETPAVLVMGGSQGARTINQALVEALPRLLDDLGVAVIHQTGTKLFEETRAALPAELAEHPRYYLRPYYADMAALYATADLAVCRAGSLSLGELYVCGVPSLLIPYPFAAANHQLRNAEASVAAGASRLLLNADCNGETLFREVRTLLSDAGIRRGMREFALKLGRPDATAHLVALIRELAG